MYLEGQVLKLVLIRISSITPDPYVLPWWVRPGPVVPADSPTSPVEIVVEAGLSPLHGLLPASPRGVRGWLMVVSGEWEERNGDLILETLVLIYPIHHISTIQSQSTTPQPQGMTSSWPHRSRVDPIPYHSEPLTLSLIWSLIRMV